MSQEEKDLLLKDLCARLPYGVMVREDTVLYDDKNTTSYRVKKLSYVQIGKGFSRIKGPIHDYEYIYIPYLFPLSSMTEEQRKYISDRWGINEDFDFEIDPNWGEYFVDLGDVVDYVNWLIENHFDFNGLISKGLALDATGLNIY